FLLPPIAMAAGLLATRLARADVADLLVGVRTASVDELRPALASLLHDPGLELAVRSSDDGEYVDAAGQLVHLPGPDDPRVPTALDDGFLLLHDPAARTEDPQLFDAAVAAVALTLKNARLTAQVRASRRRLMDAADSERHRLERDLHDGAQQTLFGVGMAL